jgi:mycofactocin precursor
LWHSFGVPNEGQESAVSEPQAEPQAELEPEAKPAQPEGNEVVDDEVVDDELLVEEVSIDGMCGVY